MKKLTFLFFIFNCINVFANSPADLTHHGSSIVILYLGLFLFLAIFSQIIKPATLGQILIGILIAIPIHYRSTFFSNMLNNNTISSIAEIGSIFLLFEIGLGSSFKEIKHASTHAFITALAGVIVPLICGYFLLAPLLFHSHNPTFGLFLGAMLAITSTGISISIFKELGIIKNPACQIVLAASVIDDIIGLILISIVSALAISGFISIPEILKLLANVGIFFCVSLILSFLLPFIIKRFIPKINPNYDMLLFILVTTCFTMAYLASLLGLASIIGAFIAGMILKNEFFVSYTAINHNKRAEKQSVLHNLSLAISPFSKIFVPIFFIYAGMQVDIISAFSLNTIVIALVLTLFAILSKVVCGMFLPKSINKLLVGFGMVPRGEIGIIFATTALELSIINNSIYTALLLMIVGTSIISPIAISMLAKRL